MMLDCVHICYARKKLNYATFMLLKKRSNYAEKVASRMDIYITKPNRVPFPSLVLPIASDAELSPVDHALVCERNSILQHLLAWPSPSLPL